MKFTIVAAGGIMLAVAGAAPALAKTGSDDLFKSGPANCPLNAFKCKKANTNRPPSPPRCRTVAVRDGNGGIRKVRICSR